MLDGVRIKTEEYPLSGEERLVKPVRGRQSVKLFLKTVTE